MKECIKTALSQFLIEKCTLTPLYDCAFRLNSIIKLKKVPFKMLDNLNADYKINYSDCNICYVGQTKNVKNFSTLGKKNIKII